MKPASESGEIWHYIHGYDERYRISNFGRIHSCERFVEDKNGVVRRIPDRILKPRISRKRDHNIRLCEDCEQTIFVIGRLVWEHFVSIDVPVMVGHKDGNPGNNHVDNLYRRGEGV